VEGPAGELGALGAACTDAIDEGLRRGLAVKRAINRAVKRPAQRQGYHPNDVRFCMGFLLQLPNLHTICAGYSESHLFLASIAQQEQQPGQCPWHILIGTHVATPNKRWPGIALEIDFRCDPSILKSWKCECATDAFVDNG